MAKAKLPGTPKQPIPKGKGVSGIQYVDPPIKLAGLQSAEVVDKPVKIKAVLHNSITTNGLSVESYDKGMEHLFSFAARPMSSGYNYCLLMLEDDGGHTLYERLSQPCWGSLREYNKGTRPNDNWPGDIQSAYHLFPTTGKVVGLSVPFGCNNQRGSYNVVDKFNRYIAEYAFSTTNSPWRSILKDIELVIRDDWFNGVVFKDTHIDPTVLSQFLRQHALANSQTPTKWCNSVDAGVPPDVAYIKSGACNGYGMSGRIVLERFFNANPFDLSNGGTLYDRESYNRPKRDYVFGGDGNVGTATTEMSIDKLTAEYHRIMNKDKADVHAA